MAVFFWSFSGFKQFRLVLTPVPNAQCVVTVELIGNHQHLVTVIFPVQDRWIFTSRPASEAFGVCCKTWEGAVAEILHGLD